MTYKFSEIAKVSKGNKKNFKPNVLTIALADKRATKDIVSDNKKISKKVKKVLSKIPWVTK